MSVTREEVVRGLEKIGEFFRGRFDMAVGDGKMLLGNWMKCAEEAAQALREMEPRVMTVEEVKAFEWDYCYLEQERQPGKEYRMIMGDYALTCITWPCITSMRIEYGDSSYGVKWRCWTGEPTEEQRRATAWN